MLGPFSKSADPAFIEASGYAGFDFIIIDLEHGPNHIKNVQNLIRAAQISGMLPIVRVKQEVPSLIGEALDIGAGGIQVPQVKNPQDIKAIIDNAKFAPEGQRGICPFVRAADYSSVDSKIYYKEANNIILVIQLEGKESLNNLDKILDIQGFDILFIGPYDLSQALGIQGQLDHPLLEKTIEDIILKCSSKNVTVGIFSNTKKDAAKWIEKGVKYIAYSVDIRIYFSGCKDVLGLR